MYRFPIYFTFLLYILVFSVSSKRKSALPNYYKRFLGVQSFKHAGEENNNNEPDSWIKPVTSPKMQDQHKVIEAVYKIPKKQDGTTIEKKAVQPEDLPPPPPPENHTSLQVFSTVEIHEVEDLPLPPPPDDFLSPPEKESNVFQSPTKHYGSSSSNSFDSSDQGLFQRFTFYLSITLFNRIDLVGMKQEFEFSSHYIFCRFTSFSFKQFQPLPDIPRCGICKTLQSRELWGQNKISSNVSRAPGI